MYNVTEMLNTCIIHRCNFKAYLSNIIFVYVQGVLNMTGAFEK